MLSTAHLQGIISVVELSFMVQEPSGIIECTRDTSLFSNFFMYLRGVKSVFIVDFTLKESIFRLGSLFKQIRANLTTCQSNPTVDKCPI